METAIGSEDAGQPLVDQRHRRRPLAVGGGEQPAAAERHAERAEVARRDHPPGDVGPEAVASLDPQVGAPAAAGERQGLRHPDRADAGQGVDAGQHPLEEGEPLGRGERPAPGCETWKVSTRSGSRPRSAPCSRAEALRHQAGAGHQHQRERHLGGDQGAAQALAAGARRAPPGVAAARSRSGPRVAWSAGARPKSSAACERDEQGEAEDGPLTPAAPAARRRRRECRGASGSRAARSGAPAAAAARRGAAGAARHQALGQELAQRAAPAGAERGAHRDLPLAARRRGRGAGWRRWRRRSAARGRPRPRARRSAGPRRRRRAAPSSGDAALMPPLAGSRPGARCSRRAAIAGISARARASGDAGRERGRRRRVVARVADSAVARQRTESSARQRADPGRRPPGRRSRRHDADDRRRLAVEPQRAADDARVGAEALAPERVAEEHDAGRALRAVRPPARKPRPSAAARRRGRGRSSARRRTACDPPRLAVPGQRPTVQVAGRRSRRTSASAAASRGSRRSRRRPLVDARLRRLPDADQALRLGERQRREEHARRPR